MSSLTERSLDQEHGRDTASLVPNGLETGEYSRTPFEFLRKIDREDLSEVITRRHPWAYWTMEIYREDIKGGGGLGMLASDTLEAARNVGIPMTFVTPFYTEEMHYELDDEFAQKAVPRRATPEERGFEKVSDVEVMTVNGHIRPTELGVYQKNEGSVKIITITEPDFGHLYQGASDSDHRIYQEVSLGFGGHKALKKLGLEPSINQQLNEAPTVFAGLARLDDLIDQTGDLEEALAQVRESTIYTNHTLVQAVEACVSMRQFEKYVFPNIENEELREWVTGIIEEEGGSVRLSTLAIELSGKKNGVSKIHARFASNQFRDRNGELVDFEGVTNGISIERWSSPELLQLYCEESVLDEDLLPSDSYISALDALPDEKLDEIKSDMKGKLLQYLTQRQDQHGDPVVIPQEAKIFNWRRRIAGYKRPGMLFEDPERLSAILETEDIHFVMSGNAHASDSLMQEEMRRIFTLVDSNMVLRQRVHFVQDYDEELARHLVQGADVSVNNPQVRDRNGERISTEACGTSWEKDILNMTLVISTDDGGIADHRISNGNLGDGDLPYLEISGQAYEDEVDSMYANIEIASKMIENGRRFEQAKKQMKEYLPTISGSRMVAEYLNLGFPKIN